MHYILRQTELFMNYVCPNYCSCFTEKSSVFSIKMLKYYIFFSNEKENECE